MCIMNTHKQNKIRNLLELWPLHTVAAVSWLEQKGYSRFLLRQYVNSGWLKRFGHGVVIRSGGDQPDWSGEVWGAQQIVDIHVGGKTALELEGKGHFVKFQEQKIYLFVAPDSKFPKWLREEPRCCEYVFTKTNLFPPNVLMKEHNFGEYFLKISTPARAFCEYLYLAEKHHGYEEAPYLIENIQFIPSNLMQQALEVCTSIRVKRLVLCLAKLKQVAWYKKLDISRIDLGSGKRQEVVGGAFDSEFQISYPKSWRGEQEEDERIF